ncbi:MAG: metal-dependent hydrolase [Planctomycetota bacterium]|nr:MAG: metal-dependent hydrolase [Planctomycetota bacterium]
MPTIITHAFTGLVAGKIAAPGKMPIRFWVLSAVCPAFPDFDVVFHYAGVHYSTFLGHRGFFHSPFFALLFGLLVTTVYFSGSKAFSRKWWLLALYFSFITAVHGIFDAMTFRGLGIAFLSPFSNERYLLPWRPLPPIVPSAEFMFSRWGAAVMWLEFKWVLVPTFAVLLLSIPVRRYILRARPVQPPEPETENHQT